MQPYTLIDYVRGFGPFPLVTQGFYCTPDYSAKRTDSGGGDVFLNGEQIATFGTMEDACKFVSEQADLHAPWWMRPPLPPPPVTEGDRH